MEFTPLGMQPASFTTPMQINVRRIIIFILVGVLEMIILVVFMAFSVFFDLNVVQKIWPISRNLGMIRVLFEVAFLFWLLFKILGIIEKRVDQAKEQDASDDEK